MSEPESSKEGREAGAEASFRVIDRRRFSADGSERGPDEPAKEPAREPAPSAVRESPVGAEPAGSAATHPADEPQAGLGQPEGEAYGDERFLPMEPTFSTLLMSLSTQALMCLGEIPEVAGQPPQRDLAAARSVIDLIGVLEEKTRGNLDAGESALLERILYDLRMRFVELSRT